MTYTSRLCALLLLPAVLVAQKTGTTDQTLEVDGKDREYVLHLPRSYKKKQKTLLPLVLMLHGRGSEGRAAASRYYGWTSLADKEKFIAVFPTALGEPRSWQGAWSGRPTVDSKFLAKLIDTMIRDFRIDKDKVFMTGHSSGGFMSFSFAITHSEKVAAIGPVAGLNVSRQKPKKPISVISYHGMADMVVPYDSKRGKGAKYSIGSTAPGSVEHFAKHNSCAKQPTRTELEKGKVHLDTWADGKDGTSVQLYSIEDGDHGWPNGRGALGATKTIWEFFKDHARGQKPAKKSKKSKRKKRSSIK